MENILERMTTSSEPVSSKNSFVKLATVLSLLFSLILLVNLVGWSAAFYGFDSGYDSAKAELKNPSVSAPPIFNEGANSYEQMSGDYSYLAWLALAIAGLVSVRYVFSNTPVAIPIFVLNIVLLLLMLKPFWFLLRLKDPSLNESLGHPFNAFLMESVNYDWISIFCALALLLIETILLLNWFRRRSS